MAIDKQTGLSDKMKRFCEEYVIDFNGTQAAIRAGYSEKTANEIASENLAKPNIQAHIKVLLQTQSEISEITAQMILAELAKIGFCNLQDYIKKGFKVEDIADLKRHHAAAIETIQIETKPDGTQKVKLKLYDKNSALDKLGRHVGLFDKDNVLHVKTEQPLLPDSKQE